MIINYLPNELILNTIYMFDDIRDIMRLFETDAKFKQIIIKNFYYIIKNLIKNNERNYNEMSLIIKSCFPQKQNFKANTYIIDNVIQFISTVSKETIIEDFNLLNEKIKEEIDDLNNNFLNNIYKKYFNLRINKKINNDDAINAVIFLDDNKLNKMNFYLGMGYEPNIAINMAHFDEEQLIELNKVMRLKINIKQAMFAVSVLNNDGINATIKLFKRGVPFMDSVNAVADQLEENELENMAELFNSGVPANIARICSVYIKKHQDIIVDMYHKNIDINLVINIIENCLDDRIDMFVKLINKNINAEEASNIVLNENIDDNMVSDYCDLIDLNIDYKFAITIVKKFNFEDINTFKFLSEEGISPDIAFDIVDNFNEEQYINFMCLINDNINEEIAYDMAMIYNEYQVFLCGEFIKNGIDYKLIEDYSHDQIKTFIEMICEEKVDFHEIKRIIDSIEPVAKRRR